MHEKTKTNDKMIIWLVWLMFLVIGWFFYCFVMSIFGNMFHFEIYLHNFLLIYYQWLNDLIIRRSGQIKRINILRRYNNSALDNYICQKQYDVQFFTSVSVYQAKTLTTYFVIHFYITQIWIYDIIDFILYQHYNISRIFSDALTNIQLDNETWNVFNPIIQNIIIVLGILKIWSWHHLLGNRRLDDEKRYNSSLSSSHYQQIDNNSLSEFCRAIRSWHAIAKTLFISVIPLRLDCYIWRRIRT